MGLPGRTPDTTVATDDQVPRKKAWLAAHPSDTIRLADTFRFGEWWTCTRDEREIAAASTLGMLLDRLETNFA